MMRTRGLVFESRLYRGDATPPSSLEDVTREHNNGVFTTAPTWEKQSSGLWALKFVSGSSQFVTLPDIKQLLGATQATWMAWVRKDAYVADQTIAGDYATTAGHLKWKFLDESAENRFQVYVGNGTTAVQKYTNSVFTTGWHFCWMRFTAASATGLEHGVDSIVGATGDVSAIAALGNTSYGHTYIGRYATLYSSITLGAFAISALALSDTEIWKWGQSRRRLLGI
jgi:hypothetical protein